MRNRIFQEDHAKDCEKLRNYEEPVVKKPKGPRQLKMDELSVQQRGGRSTVGSVSGSDSGIARQGELLD